jgi:hypothetical protein
MSIADFPQFAAACAILFSVVIRWLRADAPAPAGLAVLWPRTTGATVTRTGIWYGVAIRPAGVTPMKAYGYYIVPELPAPGFPPTTVTTSPIVSGDLFIQRH